MLLTLPVFVQAELILLDKVNCVVCGPERNTPFTDTDFTWKRNLDGQFMDSAQQIQRDIISQQIVADKIPLDPTAADKYVETLKRQNNLSDSELTELFSQVGRTYQEGLSLLNGQYTQEMFMHHKFKSQLIITDDDVKAFCEQYPEYEVGWYEVQFAIVNFTDENKDTLKKSLDELMKDHTKEVKEVSWSSPIRLNRTDIAEDKQFVFDMQPDEYKYVEDNGTFEVYKLLSKTDDRLRTFEERRSAVVDYLNRQKLESMLKKYNTEVRKFVDIINLDETVTVADN